MKVSKDNLFVIFSLLLTITPSQAKDLLFDYTIVTVKNDIQGENITIHCYFSENDLGDHQLSYGSNFTWHFDVNFWHSTKFYCDFKTNHGSGNYGVYTSTLKVRCNVLCVWLIRVNGPCLQQTNYYDQLWCQKWKIPPQFGLNGPPY
ncbi:hypothetical protein DH2020_036853 [Rehmannia glutinosa]|uniref:S-protein homolog n=1 Tax=Rehmannia glutinosa TaxID=99300 RepID=A0ABR0V5N7_REHGL